jgi:hypothetical protein
MTTIGVDLQYQGVNADHPGIVSPVPPDVASYFDRVRTLWRMSARAPRTAPFDPRMQVVKSELPTAIGHADLRVVRGRAHLSLNRIDPKFLFPFSPRHRPIHRYLQCAISVAHWELH